jgi:nucleoside-diphosphate-sugar epimerase
LHKVLITGAAGFTGRHLIKYLSDINYNDLTCVDLNTVQTDSGNTYMNVDLMKQNQVLKLIKSVEPDLIIHLAGINKSDNYKQFYELNVFMVANLLEALVSNNLLKTKMLFISSSAVYGRTNQVEVNEQSETKPVSFYGNSKLSMEFLALQYHYNYNLDIKIVRPFNLIGPEQELSFVIPQFIHQALKIKYQQSPPVMNTGNLESSRDFINVSDAVRGYWKILTHGTPGEIYNLAGNKSIKISAILDLILELIGIKEEVKVISKKPTPHEIANLIGNTQKLNKLKWKSNITIEDSLVQMIECARKEYI